MRARTVKPGFFINEELAECSMQTRLTFIGLWALADREGRLEDRPKRIKAELFPYDSVDVEPSLVELAAHKLIIRYSIGNESYILIPTFLRHQKPHPNEKPSDIPAPDEKKVNDIHMEHQGDTNVSPRYEASNTKVITTPAVSLSLCSSVSLSSVSHDIGEQVPPTPPKKKSFTPPSVEEVQAYIAEKNIALNAEYFVSYYAARGWMMGKTKMKSWKHAVATWVSRDSGGKQQVRQATLIPQRSAPPGQFDMNRQIDIANDIIAEMEEEDARQHNHGQATQAGGTYGNGSQLRQGIA